jgi:alkylhydroperoxidase family enzyme
MDERASALLEVAGPSANVNIFRVLLWHPDVLELYRPFGNRLLRGNLPARHVEMIILRIGWRCQAETEWGGHVRAAREKGLTEAEIERIADGPDADGWAPFDADLLRAVDELHDDSWLSDETWAALSAEYDRQQLIEFVLVVGNYHMLSYVMNAFRVELEPGWPGFPRPAAG